jgi:hypothetical protein
MNGGRVEPLDSVARNSLLAIREKQSLNLEPWKAWNQHPKIISATEWLANMMMNPAVANDWPVFRVDNPDLLSLLKLGEKDPAKHLDGKHYSWNQLQPALADFDKESERVQRKEAADRTAYENAVAKMHERLTLYAQLESALQPADAADWPAELAAYEKLMPDGIAAVQAHMGNVGPTHIPRLMACGVVNSFTVYAKITPELKAVLANAGPTFMEEVGGFVR